MTDALLAAVSATAMTAACVISYSVGVLRGRRERTAELEPMLRELRERRRP